MHQSAAHKKKAKNKESGMVYIDCIDMKRQRL